MTKNNTPIRFLASKKSWLVRSFFPTFCLSASASYGTNIKSRGRKSMIKRSQRPEDVNPMSFEELTPLHAAAQLGHEEAPKKAKAVAPWGYFLGGPRKLRKCPWDL